MNRITVLVACVFNSLFAFAQSPAINVYGSLGAVMQEAKFQPVVSIDTLKSTSPLFGLGVVAGLKGEIIIIDGKCYRSFVHKDEIITRIEADAKAAMLVVSSQTLNHVVSVSNLNSMQNIEDVMRRISTERNNGEPMPFLIRTRNATVNFHVIDWKEGSTHTPSNHKQFAKTGVLTNANLIIVGFFSDKHSGVFTPHGTTVHMHVYDSVKQIVGHVDAIEFFSTVNIQIP